MNSITEDDIIWKYAKTVMEEKVIWLKNQIQAITHTQAYIR